MRARVLGITAALVLALTAPAAPVPATATPSTIPTITSPTSGAVLTGAITVAVATSSTGVVIRLRQDGSIVESVQVPAQGGVATWPWETWGYQPGAYTISASDCDTYCSDLGTEVDITTQVSAPTLVVPPDGVTLSGRVTLSASADGGTLAFIINGVRRGHVPGPPYELQLDVSDLPDGFWPWEVERCTSTPRCSGPHSLSRGFWTKSLGLSAVSVVPRNMSPNGDGVSDRSTLTYRITSAGAVAVSATVEDANGVVVQGPVPLGTKAAGTYAWTWDGRSNGGAVAADGYYQMRITTFQASTGLYGGAHSGVRVDLARPTLSFVRQWWPTIYPVRDGYRDGSAVSIAADENVRGVLSVRDSTGHLVRSASFTWGARHYGWTVSWNGRLPSGALAPAGTYRWTIRATDLAGNAATSPLTGTFNVSHKRAVWTTVTLERVGSGGVVSDGSNGCRAAGPSSYGSTGLLLRNVCPAAGTSELSEVYAWYHSPQLPAALEYGDVTLRVQGRVPVGSTGSGRSRVFFGVVESYPEGLWHREYSDVVAGATRVLAAAPVSTQWLVSTTRRIRALVSVTNRWPAENVLDVKSVQFIVTLRVLR